MTQPRLTYMPQLDALRAIAVSSVMLHHFGPPAVARYLPNGMFGVRLFFVLSGFLITGILLRQRDPLESGDASLGGIARTFYTRRALRLLPLYYLTLAVIGPTLSHPLGTGWLWHLFYATNLCVAYTGAWCDFIPFWSLAVEEQFYLLWPWIVLLAPDRWLWRFFAGGLLLAPLVRLTVKGLTGNGLVAQVTLFGCLDSLAMGALLAAVVRKADWRRWLESPVGRTVFASAGLGALTVCIALHNWLGEDTLLTIGLQDSILAVFNVWFVYRASVGFHGWIGRCLSWAPLLRMGKISYGIYIVHTFVPLFVWVPDHLRDTPWEWGYRLGVFPAMAITVAALSWFFMEGPISRLKERVG
jgi:peptidoglycan/LPS O-acetylase OafA/YrhL